MTLDKYCPNIDVIEATQSPAEAVDIIHKSKFDILFLDIQMPELNGFQLLKKIKKEQHSSLFQYRALLVVSTMMRIKDNIIMVYIGNQKLL